MFNKLINFIFLDFVSTKAYSYLIKYPTPMNLNYLWNFGAMAGFFLVVQIVTGLFLTMFYIPHIDYAFSSIEHIMRDVNYGWLVRYLHSNGASFFFFIIYIHIVKAIYYGSYMNPRQIVWYTGVLIYVLMMGTAFIGYVLPWGQMSYRGATVITNLLTVIPFVGKEILYVIWGGYAINNATLQRFYTVHYLLPFVIAVFVVYHIYQLHKMGSSNSLSVRTQTCDKISFAPYFIIKDIFGTALILISCCVFVFFMPETLGHSDNYIMANPLVTPTHIVPEWYFLPLYAILRSILDKTYGIILMFLSILVLFLMPLLDRDAVRSKSMKALNKIATWMFVFNFMFLGYLGMQTPISPFIELGVICAHVHILYFLLFLPIVSIIDQYIYTTRHKIIKNVHKFTIKN